MCCLLAAAVLMLIGAGRWFATVVQKADDAVPRIALAALLVAGLAETVAVGERLMEPSGAAGATVAGLPLCGVVKSFSFQGKDSYRDVARYAVSPSAR